MQYIVISGIDGSGKTTIIESLQNYLISNGFRVKYMWMRYNHYLVKVLNAIARILRLSVKEHTESGVVWRHKYYDSPLFSSIYIWCSYIDNWIGSIKVRSISDNQYDFIICDRWINDVLIDLGSESRKLTILNSNWFLRFQKIMPLNTIQFVIVRQKDKVVECRIENKSDPHFPYRYQLYSDLAELNSVHQIDNNYSVENSVLQILDRLK